MDVKKINEIIEDRENKSNKDLLSVESILKIEFEKTKELIISLTKHLDGVIENYDIIVDELKKRKVKI